MAKTRDKIKTHTFNGHVYTVDISDAPIKGICMSPYGKKPTVHLIVNESFSALDGIIHESLHLEGWAKTEEVVDRTATSVARLLWQLGYRWKP